LIEKETQIKVLLYGDPLGFACKSLGVKNMIYQQYSQVFTVTYEEVLAYTARHGLPKTPDPSTEGFHYIKEEGRWYTFFRERGQVYDEKIFDDDELARKYILRTLLQLAGTGLY